MTCSARRSSALATRAARAACLVFALGLVLAASALAQSQTEGAIGGVVTDQTRAVMPGASVTVRNVATNATAEATTDTTGHFLVGRLQPGVYTVTVSLQGFASYRHENVTVEVGRMTNLDVSLAVAGQAETLTVTAQTPVINTRRPE